MESKAAPGSCWSQGCHPVAGRLRDIHVKKGSRFPPSHQRPNGPLRLGRGRWEQGERQFHGGQEHQAILWARKEKLLSGLESPYYEVR